MTCNAEWLFEQVAVPELVEDDVIALLNTGSYIEPMAANFNALPRPGMALISGEQCNMIKRHETVDEVFSRQVIPKYLDKDSS
jgi:diaminopimelate decarboxylase